MKKAIVFLADGVEEIEAITIIDYLRRAGVGVTSVAVPTATMKKADMVTGSHNITVIADCDFNQFKESCKNELPDLVYVPGGMPGSTNVGNCNDVLDFINLCFDNGKYIAAICAAPAVVLAKIGVLKGKEWTCYPGMDVGIEKYCSCGEDLNVTLENSEHIKDVPFVVDGNVITGRGPGTAEEFAMELVKLLAGSEVYDSIKKGSIQR